MSFEEWLAMAEKMASDPTISSEERQRLRDLRKYERRQEKRMQDWLEDQRQELERNAEEQRRQREVDHHRRLRPVKAEVDAVVSIYARRREEYGYDNVLGQRIYLNPFYR